MYCDSGAHASHFPPATPNHNHIPSTVQSTTQSSQTPPLTWPAPPPMAGVLRMRSFERERPRRRDGKFRLDDLNFDRVSHSIENHGKTRNTRACHGRYSGTTGASQWTPTGSTHTHTHARALHSSTAAGLAQHTSFLSASPFKTIW